jgi:hypothetical protein
MSMKGFFPLVNRVAAQAASRTAAFHDAASAKAWLAAQSRADARAMLVSLLAQIEAFNKDELAHRERLRALEVLRKTAYAASTECRHRFQGKPQPLAREDQEIFDVACRFWRLYGAGYRRCLQVCVEGDASLLKYAARMAHRVSFCLRVEQMTSYAAGVLPGPGFWKDFHTVFLAAERIGCVWDTVDDGLLRETRSSSVLGQYAMALMLHLAQPLSLSSLEWGAVVLWLARWREQARVDERASPGAVPLDMSADQPVAEGEEDTHKQRWLALGGIQRKIRKRIEALAGGESPESLRLGRGLSADRCTDLLTTLADRLRYTPAHFSAETENVPKLKVGAGLAFIHRLLGGKGLEDAPDAGARKTQEEYWWLEHQEDDRLALTRPPRRDASRLVLHGLATIELPDEKHRLATVAELGRDDDGSMFCTIDLLPEGAEPRMIELRNWVTGEVARHPAFELPPNPDLVEGVLLLPTGVMAPRVGVRFFDGDGELLPELRVTDCLNQGEEVDVWRIAGEV